MKPVLRMAAILAVGAVAIWGAMTLTGFTLTDLRHLGEPRNILEQGEERVRIPLPDGEPTRQLPEVPVTTEGEFGFMFDDDAVPVRYDPCRPLRWTVNPAAMPDGAEQLVRQAVQSVQDATGLAFEYVGYTDEAVAFDRPLFQERYGPGFVPILIGFSTADVVSELSGSVTGLGGSSAVYGAYGDQRFLRSGVVIMDTEDLQALRERQGGDEITRAVIAHELGHVVGLAHVDDETELMHDSNVSTVDWGPGDRAGLAIAGAGPCEQS